MFEFLNQYPILPADSFDNQFDSTDSQIINIPDSQSNLSINSFDHAMAGQENAQLLHHHDPLLHANKFQMQPLHLHMVQPHFVEGYVRADGTVVDGYYRDGSGQGYLRTNPDGILENNLEYVRNKSY
ncbi:hypothetical protein [Peribacillus acanthi]|uniref:hypothetical protein n=1 Tax=Peribacillus acanthi TaxID=2171554 RepID=UPI000D3E561A|nr:hypothetical protein [Peribacillus acanthi]